MDFHCGLWAYWEKEYKIFMGGVRGYLGLWNDLGLQKRWIDAFVIFSYLAWRFHFIA